MLIINIDGASRGNPGPSGIGILICKNKNLILNYGEFIGIRSNLFSEYLALKRALQLAQNLSEEVSIFTDCMNIIHQRKLKDRMRKKELKILFREINNLEKKFKTISYKYIPRNQNAFVDAIANKAIDYHIK
ncbi:MAG TPA: ribonuclease HI family protein [Nitrososphaeraceae archaeon]|nr:ribonuclease HI family protein [Nitrososphaeraceae archaeon]